MRAFVVYIDNACVNAKYSVGAIYILKALLRLRFNPQPAF